MWAQNIFCKFEARPKLSTLRLEVAANLKKKVYVYPKEKPTFSFQTTQFLLSFTHAFLIFIDYAKKRVLYNVSKYANLFDLCGEKYQKLKLRHNLL